MPMFDNRVVFLSAVPLTVSTVAVSVVPSSIPAGAAGMVIGVNSGSAVHWLPGANPTATFGIPVAIGESQVLEHENVSDVRFIRVGGADANCTILFIATVNIPE